jgi:hypothetical protein
MERDDAAVDNDTGQLPTPVDAEDSTVGTGPQPGEAEPARAGARSGPQAEAASSSSRNGEPESGRDPVPAVDSGGTALAGGNAAPGQDVLPGPGSQGEGGAVDNLLLPADQRRLFTAEWSDIQTHFVDQPRQSVEQADALVVDIMQRVTAGFSQERERLEAQWDQGQDVSTEELRVALTRYRSFFERLIST